MDDLDFRSFGVRRGRLMFGRSEKSLIRLILCAVLAAATCGTSSTALAADGDFKEVKRTKDGITASRAEGQRKGFYISRLDTQSPVDPDAMAAGLWQVFNNAYPPVIERKFISRDTDVIVFHDKVKTPVVSDRDYTLRARRFVDGEIRKIAFKTAPESGPPPYPGFVRMPVVQGGWEVRPAPGGGCFVRYEVYTEPGGLVPAMLIREPLTNDAINYVRRCIKDAAPKQ